MKTMEEISSNACPRSSEDIRDISLNKAYDVLKTLGRGTYGKVVLARCKQTDTVVALKQLPKSTTKLKDFQRELNWAYFLSAHTSVINTFDVAFQTKSHYILAQEHAPLGDLFDTITPQMGLPEKHAKTIMIQIASALDFMHSKNLVHRDVKPENILVFDETYERVKLIDFGMTRPVGTLVRKQNGTIPYTPPEICESLKGEGYTVESYHDVWAFAVLLFCVLTGNFPWENADEHDSYYKEFRHWQRRKTSKVPSQWGKFTTRLMRLFRKLLDVKPIKRCPVTEIHKYVDDTWIKIRRQSQGDDDDDYDDDYSSSEQAEIAEILQQHGVETDVSKEEKRSRIASWLVSSSR